MIFFRYWTRCLLQPYAFFLRQIWSDLLIHILVIFIQSLELTNLSSVPVSKLLCQTEPRSEFQIPEMFHLLPFLSRIPPEACLPVFLLSYKEPDSHDGCQTFLLYIYPVHLTMIIPSSNTAVGLRSSMIRKWILFGPSCTFNRYPTP